MSKTPSSSSSIRRPQAKTLDSSYRTIIALAWPASVAASITPLLGVIDVWALGHSPRPLDIAAVGLAAVIFSLAYWTFGFIRMSVAGLTAQAAGAGDAEEGRLAFIRALLLGGTIGVVLMIFQWPIGKLAFHLLAIDSEASDATFRAAGMYYSIRIWGAPFALATYACLGWLTARGRTDFLMITALVMTVVNIILDLAFVLIWDMGAAGIATGTLIAESIGFAVSGMFVVILLREDDLLTRKISWQQLLHAQRLKRTLSVNRDVFLRTLLLAFSFTWFVQRGSGFGDVTLAANQVLLQLFLFSGLAIDGTAIAAETLVGQALGKSQGGHGEQADVGDARKKERHLNQHALNQHERAYDDYRLIVRRGFILAGAIALIFVSIYAFFGRQVLGLLTPPGIIFDAAWRFWPWIIISPMIVMVCFQLDGIFVGATRSREMRDSMIVSVLLFLPLSVILGNVFGNHGLWLAFSLFFLTRAVSLWFFLPAIKRSFLRSV